MAASAAARASPAARLRRVHWNAVMRVPLSLAPGRIRGCDPACCAQPIPSSPAVTSSRAAFAELSPNSGCGFGDLCPSVVHILRAKPRRAPTLGRMLTPARACRMLARSAMPSGACRGSRPGGAGDAAGRTEPLRPELGAGPAGPRHAAGQSRRPRPRRLARACGRARRAGGRDPRPLAAGDARRRCPQPARPAERRGPDAGGQRRHRHRSRPRSARPSCSAPRRSGSASARCSAATAAPTGWRGGPR